MTRSAERWSAWILQRVSARPASVFSHHGQEEAAVSGETARWGFAWYSIWTYVLCDLSAFYDMLPPAGLFPVRCQLLHVSSIWGQLGDIWQSGPRLPRVSKRVGSRTRGGVAFPRSQTYPRKAVMPGQEGSTYDRTTDFQASHDADSIHLKEMLPVLFWGTVRLPRLLGNQQPFSMASIMPAL